MDLSQITTKTGKTMEDFSIPESLIENDAPLVELILKSESMDDGERQYWFNLSEVMSAEQTEKLRGILSREQTKLAEIEEKYGEKKIDPVEAKKRALAMAKDRVEKQQTLQEKEAAHNEKEAEEEASILAELDNL